MVDQLVSDKTLACNNVMLNLQGAEEYDCQIPWLNKNMVDRLLVADLFIYVDNGRSIDPTEDMCWKASRKWGSTCS